MISIFYEKEGVSRLFVQNFCLTVPKNFVRGPFCFTNILVWKKLWTRGGRSITIFCQNFFVSVPRNFVEKPFSVPLISDIEKFFASEGYSTIFRREFFVTQFRKIW